MIELQLKNKFTVSRDKFVYILCGLLSTIALPQFFHLIGMISGTGKSVAVIFSPMHFPVIIIGLLAGPLAGLIVGVLGPIISFFLTGMPNINNLTLMIVELSGYGLMAGLLKNKNIPIIFQVFLTQFFGRLFRMFFCMLLFKFLNRNIEIMSIWYSIPRCLPGIILQLIIIPLIIFRINAEIYGIKK